MNISAKRARHLGGWLVLALMVGGAWPVAVLSIPKSEQVAQQVYSRWPDFPREGSDRPDSSLVRRLALYHTKVCGRPTTSRLDWKLTLADYLGVNLAMSPETYPEANGRPDLLNADRRAIDRFTRAERNRLVETLVQVYLRL
ncbi:MAG: hypothetical protein H7Y22_08530 [Gemmatimonadaceae bacterium]|nr:hypothetical protein [Gloeobacterales cyanobacterium ES-bin-141]